MAHKLNLPEARQDPLRFPAEIFTIILSFLAAKDLKFVHPLILLPTIY